MEKSAKKNTLWQKVSANSVAPVDSPLSAEEFRVPLRTTADGRIEIIGGGDIVCTKAGRVIRLSSGKELGYGQNRGYTQIYIGADEKRPLRHELVCSAWNGVRPEGMVCDHINGNTEDDRPENLRWVTLSENSKNRHPRPKKEKPSGAVAVIDPRRNVCVGIWASPMAYARATQIPYATITCALKGGAQGRAYGLCRDFKLRYATQKDLEDLGQLRLTGIKGL